MGVIDLLFFRNGRIPEEEEEEEEEEGRWRTYSATSLQRKAFDLTAANCLCIFGF